MISPAEAAELLSSTTTSATKHPCSRDANVTFLNDDQIKSFKFILPCRIILSGPSMSGKSQMILNIMKNYDNFFSEHVDYCIYFYPEQEGLDESRQAYIKQLKEHIPDLITVEGFPAMNRITRLAGKKMLLLDDMFHQLADNLDFVNLCTIGSHHGDISFFLTTQNMYWPSRHRLTIVRNCTDLILWQGILDKSQMYTLGRQLFEDRHFLVSCFEWLKKRYKHQYKRALWIDLNCLNHEMQDCMRVRANFVDRNPLILFEK